MSEQRDAFSPKGKQEIVSKILPYLMKVPNLVERAEYLTRIASRLQVDENLLMLEMRKMPGRKRELAQLNYALPADQVTPAENTLLLAMLERKWAELTFQQLEPELFEGLRTKEIFQSIFQLKEQVEELTTIVLRQRVTDEADRDLIEGLALRSAGFPLTEEIIKSSVQALRKKHYERLSRQLQEEIKAEEKEDSSSHRIDELLIQKEKLRHTMQEEETAISSKRLP